jgi:hypothetical protein
VHGRGGGRPAAAGDLGLTAPPPATAAPRPARPPRAGRGARAAARATACAAVAAVALFAGALRAQIPGTPEAPPTARARWHGVAELNGNVLFGAASQRLVGSRVSAGRADSALALRAEFQSSYGEARDAADVRRVVARTVRLAVGADRQPAARLSAFALGDAESNFQQRIALRVNGGAGAKRTFWRPAAADPGFAEDLSVSLALLAERTRALEGPGGIAGGAGARVRWSLRARYRRRIAPTVRLTHVTLYQPAVDAPVARATAESTTILAVDVRPGLAFTATLRDLLRLGGAAARGRSDHDGQVLFGVRAAF